MGWQECFKDTALLSVFSSMRVPPAGLAERAVWPGDGAVLLPAGGGRPALQPLPGGVLRVSPLPPLLLQWPRGAVPPSDRGVPQLPRVYRWEPLWKVSAAKLRQTPGVSKMPVWLGACNSSVTLTGNMCLNQHETGSGCWMSSTYFLGKCMWECACNACGWTAGRACTQHCSRLPARRHLRHRCHGTVYFETRTKHCVWDKLTPATFQIASFQIWNSTCG